MSRALLDRPGGQFAHKTTDLLYCDVACIREINYLNAAKVEDFTSRKSRREFLLGVLWRD